MRDSTLAAPNDGGRHFMRSARRRLPRAPLSDVRFELAAILLLVPILMHAALWNGFPLLFFDTGAYMLEGFGRVFVPERSAVYSLFLHYARGRASLWYVVAAQCLMVGFVLVEFARAVRPHTNLWTMLGIGFFLALFTGLAWVSGQVEPDCLTALVVLGCYPLAFHLSRLGFARALLLIMVTGFAIGSHPSHLGLCAGLVLMLANLKLAAYLLRRRLRLPAPKLLPALAAFAFGLALVLTANYSLTRKVFVSRSGNVFFAARLIGDGIAKKTLDSICAEEHLVLCPYRDYLPESADSFLWGPHTPFNRIGRFYGPNDQYALLVSESLKRYPFEVAGAGLWDSVRQFFMVRTGDGISPAEWVLNPGFASFMPWQSADYLAARQQQGLLRFESVNVVQVPLIFLSLIWLVFVLRQAWARRQWGRAMLPAYLFLALAGNALVCGIFSGPHDRYQSRIAWLPAFALLLTERRNLLRGLRPGE
jgi:hypothetical protein